MAGEFIRALDEAVEAALNAGCRAIQEALGIQTGDVAGMHFSGNDASAHIRKTLATYLVSEYEQATCDYEQERPASPRGRSSPG